LFHSLKRVQAWVPVDGYYDMGAGPRITRDDQEQNYPLSQCMSCGCCLDACPQFNKVEVQRQAGESDEAFEARKKGAYESEFIGAHAISRAMLFNSHPVAKSLEKERLEVLTAPGGVQACGNAQNCVSVCPKQIPLTTSIARAGRAVTFYAFKKFFDR